MKVAFLIRWGKFVLDSGFGVFGNSFNLRPAAYSTMVIRGLFLVYPENFSGPKSQLPLVLKS